MAASSPGKWPRVRTARLSFEFSASIAFVTGMRVGGAKVSATTQRCGIWCDHPGCLVTREVAAGANRPPELRVQRLDRVRGVDDPPDRGAERIERDHLLPVPAPALRDSWIFLAPMAFLECLQRGQRGIGILGAIDAAQRLGDGLAVLPGGEAHAVSDEMDNAGLDHRFREHGVDRIGEAFEPVAAKLAQAA